LGKLVEHLPEGAVDGLRIFSAPRVFRRRSTDLPQLPHSSLVDSQSSPLQRLTPVFLISTGTFYEDGYAIFRSLLDGEG
jgi:hypothetical protein